MRIMLGTNYRHCVVRLVALRDDLPALTKEFGAGEISLIAGFVIPGMI
jgi:hypothetical protein